MYHTYILFSEKLNKYYIGATEDLSVRLQQHNSGRNASTKAGAPWRMVWSKTFETRSEALAEEKPIKGKKSRKYTEWMINSQT